MTNTVPEDGGVGQPILDLTECKWWIEFLHGDSPGLVHISSTSDWKGFSFDLDHMDELLAYIAELDSQQVSGIYLRACTLRQPPRGGGRGSEHDSYYFPGFWADLDLAGPGHRTTEPLPPDRAAAERILEESGLPEPTLWVNSGGGLYPWWILHRPQTLDNNLEAVKLMSQQWQDVIAAAAARLGYHYGSGVGDLARVLRLPGTVNRKVPGALTRCFIEAQDGVAYSLQQLDEGLAIALKRMHRLMPEPMKTEQVEVGGPSFSNGQGLSPFDHYEQQTEWDEILVPHGWRESHSFGRTRYWVRPGKNPRDGHSATTGHDPQRDRLYVFSTETPFTVGSSYTKPAAYAVLNHSGDMKAAARELKRQGYGTSHEAQPLGYFTMTEPATVTEHPEYEMNDWGNGQRMAQLVGHRYRYVERERLWYMYDGCRWIRDEEGAVRRDFKMVLEMIHREADLIEDSTVAKKQHKFAVACGNMPRINAGVGAFRDQSGISVTPSTFDSKQNLLNLLNGTLDLKTGQMRPHQSQDMLTKQFNASYNPEATCPRWEQFLEEAIPDLDTREYVQQALGYSLLGEADQRKMFILHGPSGTGKSQLMRAMQLLFGDYGASAAPAAFRVRRGEVITNDIHDLRGKRFVTTSETSIDTLIDEELIKRFTGNDIIRSRALYQENIEWRPNSVIWMATNHLPNLNSDDDAIWHRIETIRMDTVFAGRSDEIGAFAEKVLFPEADGILNWLLEGVRLYRQHELRNRPAPMQRMLVAYQEDTDTVAQFMRDALEDEMLLSTQPETAQLPIEAMGIYNMYKAWCDRSGVPKLGSRRFGLRMRRLGYESYRSNGIRWRDLWTGKRGVTGQMPLLR